MAEDKGFSVDPFKKVYSQRKRPRKEDGDDGDNAKGEGLIVGEGDVDKKRECERGSATVVEGSEGDGDDDGKGEGLATVVEGSGRIVDNVGDVDVIGGGRNEGGGLDRDFNGDSGDGGEGVVVEGGGEGGGTLMVEGLDVGIGEERSIDGSLTGGNNDIVGVDGKDEGGRNDDVVGGGEGLNGAASEGVKMVDNSGSRGRWSLYMSLVMNG